ncbi:hypothetical protein JW859_13525 [bacterium]|nr:hypothetical protein [bacterium]
MGHVVTGKLIRILWLITSMLCAFCLVSCSGGGPGGGGTTKTVYEQEPADDLPPDDTLAAKNPSYVDYMVELRNIDYALYYVNGSDSVISLTLSEAENETEKARLDQLYPTMQALAAANNPAGILPSIDLLDRFTKTTDDAVYAALERAFHDGDAVNAGGKQQLLADILAGLKAQPASDGRDLALGFIAAAIHQGGGTADAGAGTTFMATIESNFLANEFLSKPLGFYAGDATLELVFQRDRLLQQSFGWPFQQQITWSTPDIELSAMAAIATVLDDNPDLLAAYDKYQRVNERLTNPTSNLDLRDLLPFKDQFGSPAALRDALIASDAWQTKVIDRNASNGENLGVAFWPFSYSKEGVLMASMPPGAVDQTDMMDIFTAAIQSGEVSLVPLSDSGWYDYQVFALETFLLPDRGYEYANLMMSGLYKQRLKNAFEALITQRRETHIKQLETGCELTCGPMEPPTPRLRVEPAITHFLRTARGYAMLVGALKDVLGSDAFAGVPIGADQTAAASLEASCAVFYGLHLLSCLDVGIPCGLDAGELDVLTILEPPEELTEELLAQYPVAADPALSEADALALIACCQHAEDWLAGLWDSDFLAKDPRVIVPVFKRADTNNLRCWAVLGVKLVKLEASYARPPRLVQVNTWGSNPITLEQARQQLAAGGGASITWDPLEKLMPVYVFAEVEIGPDPLTRAEFRAICDTGSTREEIITALNALGT